MSVSSEKNLPPSSEKTGPETSSEPAEASSLQERWLPERWGSLSAFQNIPPPLTETATKAAPSSEEAELHPERQTDAIPSTTAAGDAKNNGLLPTESDIIEAICQVYDPDIPVNIYDLGLIYAIDIEENGFVHVDMTLTSPSCPSAQDLPVMVHNMISIVPGVREVEVDLVWTPPWDISRMSDEARLMLNIYE